MLLQSFNSIFPEQDFLEHIQLPIPEDNGNVMLNLVDFYCPGADCDCCQLLLKVMDQDENVYATFAYGWERSAFYEEWGMDSDFIDLLTTGFLDEEEEQSQYASDLLEPLLKS